jgi:hypothetical protein
MGGNRLLSFTFPRNGNLCNIGHEQSIISAWAIPINGRMGNISPFRAPPPTSDSLSRVLNPQRCSLKIYRSLILDTYPIILQTLQLLVLLAACKYVYLVIFDIPAPFRSGRPLLSRYHSTMCHPPLSAFCEMTCSWSRNAGIPFDIEAYAPSHTDCDRQ